MQIWRQSGGDGAGVNLSRVAHAECEIRAWIKAVTRLEGVEFIRLSAAVKYSRKHTLVPHSNLISVSTLKSHCSFVWRAKCFFFPALVCQADGSAGRRHRCHSFIPGLSYWLVSTTTASLHYLDRQMDHTAGRLSTLIFFLKKIHQLAGRRYFVENFDIIVSFFTTLGGQK